MLRNFPLHPQQIEQGCVYLRRDEIHQELTEKLNRSIVVTAHGDNQNGGGTINDVIYHLMSTFRRRYLEFPVLKYSANTFLVELPPDLDQDEVIEAGNWWGFHTEWSFSQWDVNDAAGFEPKWFRVRLRIDKFPLDFWHKSHMQRVISQCGKIIHIEEQFIEGNDRTNLIIEILCINPKMIPYSSLLPYGRK